MRLLFLSPYHGGSHRQFIEQWQEHSRHGFSLAALPARHFKWRMRQSSVGLASQARLLQSQGFEFDAVLTSSVGNAAELRGLLPRSYATLPLAVYFHENQLVYPSRSGERDKQQGWDVNLPLNNWQSCLAADQIWFNSAFNRDTLLAGLQQLLRKMPDEKSLDTLALIRSRARVLAPGITPIPITEQTWQSRKHTPLHIVWVARWEHDKNPALFFAALSLLQRQGVAFRLSILGERFRNVPDEFNAAERQFAAELQHFGYQPELASYHAALRQADVVVSTAAHEFFGLALLEAVSAGCYPLVPDQLVYPELYPRDCLFSGDTADVVAERLTSLASYKLRHGNLQGLFERGQLAQLVEGYSWAKRALVLDQAAETLPARLVDAAASTP